MSYLKTNKEKYDVIAKTRSESQRKNTPRFSCRQDQISWIQRQIEYDNFSQNYELRFDLKSGEIYEIDWGINVNAEFSARHYGVVLVDSSPSNPLVTVCPLKTNHKGANPKSDIDLGMIDDLHSTHSTIAVINQIRTMDKLRIYSKSFIGYSEQRYLAERNDSAYTPIKLERYKLNKIYNAYANYLKGKDLNSPIG